MTTICEWEAGSGEGQDDVRVCVDDWPKLKRNDRDLAIRNGLLGRKLCLSLPHNRK